MAVKFILTLVLLQLVTAAPDPDPEPDPAVNVNVMQKVDVSCGCSKCPCDKGMPEPEPEPNHNGDAGMCDNKICNGTLWGIKGIRTGVCAPCSGYKGWFSLYTFGTIIHGCDEIIIPTPPTYACDCYINGCSNCSCTVPMGIHSVPGVCADKARTGPIPVGVSWLSWTDHGNNFGCEDCTSNCHCYTPPP